MSIYAMADFHLSESVDKPMDIFGPAWDRHSEKIVNNWPLTEDDIIVIPGDLSWAMNMSELKADIDFLAALPGKKIISKGNHDYWWSSATKLKTFVKEYDGFYFLHNNSFEIADYSICGTRGWITESGKADDKKILRREIIRLDISLKSANKEPIVFLHYPPVTSGTECSGIIEILTNHGVKECYYGHLHGKSLENAFKGEKYGIHFIPISADRLGFFPILVRKCDKNEPIEHK